MISVILSSCHGVIQVATVRASECDDLDAIMIRLIRPLSHWHWHMALALAVPSHVDRRRGPSPGPDRDSGLSLSHGVVAVRRRPRTTASAAADTVAAAARPAVPRYRPGLLAGPPAARPWPRAGPDGPGPGSP